MLKKAALGIIQETLLIPLWARAFEIEWSARKSAEIMADFDYNADKFSHGKSSQVG